MLSKLLPLVVVGVGVQKGFEKAAPLLEGTKSVAVQSELNSIAKVLALEALESPVPQPAEFPSFVRRLMHPPPSAPNRDTAKDQWGNLYRLEIKGQVAIILSDGPDRKSGTQDDLKATLRLR